MQVLFKFHQPSSNVFFHTPVPNSEFRAAFSPVFFKSLFVKLSFFFFFLMTLTVFKSTSQVYNILKLG